MGAAAREILSVTPGITGLWQVSGRNGTTFAERVRIDVRYAHTANLLLDLRILARTIRVVATGHGACCEGGLLRGCPLRERARVCPTAAGLLTGERTPEQGPRPSRRTLPTCR